MADLFDVSFKPVDGSLSADAIVACADGQDVIVSSINDRFDAALIERLPKSIKLIAQFGNGFDNIDIARGFDR